MIVLVVAIVKYSHYLGKINKQENPLRWLQINFYCLGHSFDNAGAEKAINKIYLQLLSYILKLYAMKSDVAIGVSGGSRGVPWVSWYPLSQESTADCVARYFTVLL